MEPTFIELLQMHKTLVNEQLNFVINDLIKRSQEHDMDKIYDPEILKTYQEHFPSLKKIPFGTKEYVDFEKTYFDNAHQKHAQNRHHYYSPRNNSVKPNLIDLLEGVIDIYASNKQYNDQISIDGIINILKDKHVFDYSLEEYIKNTLNTFEE